MKTHHPIMMLASLTLLTSLATGAKADVFDFSYTGDGVSASGALTTGVFSDDVGGLGLDGLQITGITGTRNGVSISGLIDDSSFPNNTIVGNIQFDNGLLTSPLGFDYFGLAFTTTDGNAYNVYSNNYPTGGGYTEFLSNDWGFTPVTLSLTSARFSPDSPVPDGANCALLLAVGLGFCILGTASRQRTLQPQRLR